MAMLFPRFTHSFSELMNASRLLSESGNDLSSIGKERNSIADSLQYFASSLRPNSWFSASVRAETITSTPSRRAAAMSSGSQSQPLGLGKIARRQEPASIQYGFIRGLIFPNKQDSQSDTWFNFLTTWGM